MISSRCANSGCTLFICSGAGLNFEKLHGMIEPTTGEQLYSLRVTGSARAITCLIKGPTIVLLSLHVQHDKAYR